MAELGGFKNNDWKNDGVATEGRLNNDWNVWEGRLFSVFKLRC